jgi:hypothetical protein
VVRVGRFSKLAEANRAAYTLEQLLGWRVSITDASAAAAPGGSGSKGTAFER